MNDFDEGQAGRARRLEEGLGALAPAEFIMSAATVPMGGGQ